MGKYVQWATQKGVRILVVNAAGLQEAEYLAALEELKQESHRDRTGAPVLMDLTNTTMTANTSSKGKELDATAKKEGIPVGPMAVVGLSKTARTVGKLMSPRVHFDDTVEQAREWLAGEAGKHR
jgi:hypothetical protein